MPADGPLSLTTDLELPPHERCRPPGTYWLVPPRGAISMTCSGALRAALSDVLPGLRIALEEEPR
ncbi:hypothetical protein [Streptomyces niveus]|uniref:hypothetical protein n=1 Tax=Streptomyces niveus TaxID=193462 RepID=UPI00369C1B19